MPTVFSHSREGFRLRLSAALLGFCLAAAVLCGPAAAQQNRAFFLKISPPNWALVEDPYKYTSETLYRYINGAADLFLSYGFVEMNGAQYGRQGRAGAYITVDVYDMGTVLNAFGVYQTRLDADARSAGAGTASFYSDGYLVLYKDRFYVELQGAAAGPQQEQLFTTAAGSISDLLPGDTRPPEELALLPSADRIAGSERYVCSGILGHSFYSRGMLARYRAGQEILSAFVALFDSEAAAADAFTEHKRFLSGSGAECKPFSDRFQCFLSREPWHGQIAVVRAGTYIAGVFDIDTTASGIRLLEDIHAHLPHRPAKDRRTN